MVIASYAYDVLAAMGPDLPPGIGAEDRARLLTEWDTLMLRLYKGGDGGSRLWERMQQVWSRSHAQRAQVSCGASTGPIATPPKQSPQEGLPPRSGYVSARMATSRCAFPTSPQANPPLSLAAARLVMELHSTLPLSERN
jgi:hypothetical protein